MTARPHARYRPPAPVSEADLDAMLAARAAARATARARYHKVILELVRTCGPLCPTELAARLGWPVERARATLDAFEAAGMLTSEHRPAPRTGQGRRYFALRQP